MNWDQLLSATRFGLENLNLRQQHVRTEFQRDYDRLIFSPSFRRLQNKTQVFPLPGAVFVHNRLTHSLEVASVGRSLANNVSMELMEKYKGQEWTDKLQSLDDIVATACLAHDMGNPPFGHSGERAIISFFKEGEGQRFQDVLTPHQWADLTHFDGNANAFRLLTHQFRGHREGGFALTYSSLASIIKYPYASTVAGPKPKFGFFQAEEESFLRVAEKLGLEKIEIEGNLGLDTPTTEIFEHKEYRYSRHPLCFLVEAADDICYQIMDIEDAHNLKLLSTPETQELLLGFFEGEQREKVKRGLQYVPDINEQIGYLRSRAIGTLVYECTQVFLEHEEEILAGTYQKPLIQGIPTHEAQAYQHCSDVAFARIYNSSDVVDIELAGYQIITVLLQKLIDAVLHPSRAYSRLLLDRIPAQYDTRSESVYIRILSVLDYISGMTDVYALDLYRKIYGMSLPSL
jgi:dGTPase